MRQPLMLVLAVAFAALTPSQSRAGDQEPVDRKAVVPDKDPVPPPIANPVTASAAARELTCEGPSSQVLTSQAWTALEAASTLDQALVCASATIRRWYPQADAQQATAASARCPQPQASKEARDAYFAANWAVSDVATCLFIQGEALRKLRRGAQARVAYQAVIDRYSCAYTWDQHGFFWRTADGAREKLAEMK